MNPEHTTQQNKTDDMNMPLTFVKKSIPWLLLLAFFWGGQAYINRDLVSHTPPPIQGKTLQGQTFQLEQLKGKPALIYFWASWCSICRLMENSVSDISRNTATLAIAMQSGGDEVVSGYLKQKKLRTPVLNDPNGQVAALYGIKGVPTVFILDTKGNIKYASSGYSPAWLIQARLWLAGR